MIQSENKRNDLTNKKNDHIYIYFLWKFSVDNESIKCMQKNACNS